MSELQLLNGKRIVLVAGSNRSIKENILRGSETSVIQTRDIHISRQQFVQTSYRVELLAIKSKETIVHFTEKGEGLLFETMLQGEVHFKLDTQPVHPLLPGQYVLHQLPGERQFKGGVAHSHLSVYYTRALLADAESLSVLPALLPKALHSSMTATLQQLLKHPYDNDLLSFYYGNCVRDLLFQHSTQVSIFAPNGLSSEDIARMHELDRYIAEHLDTRHSLADLARRAGINITQLKKQYELVFGTTIFNLLIRRKMDFAKQLLEKTNLPLKDICMQAGYRSPSSFLTEFKRKFAMTPKQWRKRYRS